MAVRPCRSARHGPRTASSTTLSRCSTTAKSPALRFKVELPNYGVFDEKRVFAPGPLPGPVGFRGVRLGLPICEDIWFDQVVGMPAETGAEMMMVPNGSPYSARQGRRCGSTSRLRASSRPACRSFMSIRCGGQDELVFDGASFGLNADRSLAFQLPHFEERVTTLTSGSATAGAHGGAVDGPMRRSAGTRATGGLARLHAGACATMSNKNSFQGVVLGLSGGINSALCRGDGGRCARPAARALRHAALSLHLAAKSSTTPPESPRRSACATTSCRSRAPVRGFEAGARAAIRGRSRGRHRGEPAVPHARHDPDGDIQQVRPRWW